MNQIKLQCFHHDNSASLKSPQFPRFLRKLNLRWCHLGNEDIPYDICELLNLQILDLTGNNFSRLHSGLSRIPSLKFLNLSYCKRLVELPDLPSSIAILKAEDCDSLQSIRDLSCYKWLWKVSLWRRYKLLFDKRVLHSLLQGNVVEDRFMSVRLPNGKPLEHKKDTRTLITLQLPQNWHSDFSGFLFSADNCEHARCSIVIKQAMSINSQPDHDHWEEFDKKAAESYEYLLLSYVPFGSLRHTRWWNPAYTKITFEVEGIANVKVGLVPRKSTVAGDSSEITVDRSEFWDKEREDAKTFEFRDNSKSSNIEIIWSHGHIPIEGARY